MKDIELTNKQNSCVQFQPKGSLLIRGIPGSGKSTIILARAQYLQTKFPNDSTLILTFSRTLTNYVKELAVKLGNKPVEAMTFHYWAQSLLKETDTPHTRLILGDQRKEAIRFAKNIIKKHAVDASFPKMKDTNNEEHALIEFLSNEIEWIKGMDIQTKNEYLDIARSGRGLDVRVTQKNRMTIYAVLEKYNELLAKHFKYQGIDSEDLARILFKKANLIPEDLKPDHILVDEAQDLHAIQLRAISSIAKKSLTIGADKGQQIYRRSFTWKKAGIDVQGSRSRFLNETFRSTRQIIQLANDFQEKDENYVKDEDYIKASLPETNGKVPQVCFCDNQSKEEEIILQEIKKIRASFPNDTIGIIATRKRRLSSFLSLMENNNIPVYNLSEQEQAEVMSPGVKLITFHSSKGLEFDHVFVTGLKKGNLPYKAPGMGEDEIDFMSRERKKFYVAMTRARKTLFITALRPYSPFIDDLNKKLYDTYNKPN